jgi:AAA family ATP:ADP antiporter
MSLFVVSVFWSVMVDIFRSAQAKRLFGFIAVGGTLGSLAGSATTALLVKTIGTVNLLLVSAVLLEIAAVMVTTLAGRFSRGAPNADGALPSDEDSEQVDLRRLPIGGSLWSGFTHVARSRYLSAVALFLALFTFGSTVLYFTQTEVIGTYFTDREARTAILARMEFATQALTALTQAFFTGRIIRTFGLPVALALMPALSMIGFAMLGLSMWGVTPLLATFVVFQVLRRAMNFSITNPSMEILFTVVSREDKYKAKNFIETFVYRAGDQLAAWGYAGLALVGLGLAAISWISVPIAGLFLAIGLWLGREQQRRAREVGAPAKVGSSASS